MERITVRVYDAALGQKLRNYFRRQAGYGKSANVAAVELLAAGLGGNEQLDRIEQKVDNLLTKTFIATDDAERKQSDVDEVQTDLDDQLSSWL